MDSTVIWEDIQHVYILYDIKLAYFCNLKHYPTARLFALQSDFRLLLLPKRTLSQPETVSGLGLGFVGGGCAALSEGTWLPFAKWKVWTGNGSSLCSGGFDLTSQSYMTSPLLPVAPRPVLSVYAHHLQLHQGSVWSQRTVMDCVWSLQLCTQFVLFFTKTVEH